MYLSLDDSGAEVKAEEVQKTSVDLASDVIVNGVSFGPMQVGVAPVSALFIVYGWN